MYVLVLFNSFFKFEYVLISLRREWENGGECDAFRHGVCA